MPQRRLRIRFRKQDDLRLVGHLDLVRAWERLLRRAEVPLCMTAGFHPRPRMHFPSALPLAAAGLEEVLEVEVASDEPLSALRERIERAAPPGLRVCGLIELEDGARRPDVVEVEYEFPLPRERVADAAQRVSGLLASPSLYVERKGGRCDLRALLAEAAVAGGTLRMRLRVTREASLRARDVLAALELTDLESQGSFLTRTRVLLAT